MRVVRTPTGAVVLDATGRMAGRGAYLCADGSCWTAALKKSALDRALSVRIPVELRAILERGPGPSEAPGNEPHEAVSHGA